MNLHSIVISNSIGMALAFLVMYSSATVRKRRDMDSRLLTAMLIILASCCLMEMTSFLVDGKQDGFSRVMTWVSNSWIYIGNPVFSVLWLFYVDFRLHRKPKRLTKVYWAHLLLTGVCVAAVLGNFWGGYLFTIDENNVFHRQPGAYLIFAFPIVMIVCSLLELHRYKKVHNTDIFFPIGVFLAPFFTGFILQVLIYGVSLGWVATAVGITALHMAMQNELAYRDALTGLYNRQYLDFMLNDWHGHSGIMIDMDFFKSINDRFGHSQGDLALKDLAGLLRDVSPDNSIPIRFAGDEFILLLHTRVEKEITEIEARLRAAAEEFNKTSERPYQISLSMGHAVYSQESSDEFLEAIDHAMYLNKQQRHASGELADRRHRRGGENA